MAAAYLNDAGWKLDAVCWNQLSVHQEKSGVLSLPTVESERKKYACLIENN
jgi:hypothetical protein